MRKDVKLGFAIGAVLLAVAIVFALVNSHKPTQVVDADDAGLEPAAVESRAVEQPKAVVPAKPLATAEQPKPAQPPVAVTPVVTVTPTTAGPSTVVPPAATDAFANGATNWDETFRTGTPSLSAQQTVKVPAERPAAPVEVEPAVSTVAKPAIERLTPPVKAVPDYLATNHAVRVDADDVVARASASMAASPARAQLVTRGEQYAVKAGDTFSTIALAHYGAARQYTLIAKANPNVDPTRLKIGQVLSLPAVDRTVVPPVTGPAAATPAVERAIDSAKQYRVQPGDALHRISMKLYGSSNKVDAIYDLNKATIGPDRAKLRPGMVLNLPGTPSVAQR